MRLMQAVVQAKDAPPHATRPYRPELITEAVA